MLRKNDPARANYPVTPDRWRELTTHQLPRPRTEDSKTMPNMSGLVQQQTTLVTMYDGSTIRVPASRDCTTAGYTEGAWGRWERRQYGRYDNPQVMSNHYSSDEYTVLRDRNQANSKESWYQREIRKLQKRVSQLSQKLQEVQPRTKLNKNRKYVVDDPRYKAYKKNPDEDDGDDGTGNREPILAPRASYTGPSSGRAALSTSVC